MTEWNAMSYEHDRMADKAMKWLKDSIRANPEHPTFSDNVALGGKPGPPAPVPDGVLVDDDSKVSECLPEENNPYYRVAVEFKRTTEGYGGVCKSFGQAFDYLNKYHGSYMFVPRNVDGRNIAESWVEQIENLDKPIGLIVYDGDVDACEVVVELKQQDINPERLIAKPDLSDRYWARYNDITPSEIISYLRACYVVLEKDNRERRIQKYVAENTLMPEEQRSTLLQYPFSELEETTKNYSWDGTPGSAIGQKAKFGYADGRKSNDLPLNDLCRKALIQAAGTTRANNILNHFGRPSNSSNVLCWEDNKAFAIVERDHRRLSEVRGIGENLADTIHQEWVRVTEAMLVDWRTHWETDLDNWGHITCPLCPQTRPTVEGGIFSVLKNRKTMFIQMGLITGDWNLSPLGNELLRIGTEYGAVSQQFKDAFAYCILVPGKHLRLINELNGFLENRREPIHSANEAQTGFENWLEESGSLKRNPGKNAGAGNLQLKSPIQIWNHLGLLKGKSFAKDIEDSEGVGPAVIRRIERRDGAMYSFDFEKIADVLIKGAKTFGV